MGRIGSKKPDMCATVLVLLCLFPEKFRRLLTKYCAALRVNM